MSVFEGPLVFVDIETNGLNRGRGRVIEVAAIRTDDRLNETQTFTSVIDPETEIPAFITRLTGISPSDVAGAPVFADIADELYELMEDAVFVAHNARFDYAFLKHEFKRVGKRFNPKLLCTVRLSQALYPGVSGHKLENVIQRCGITVKQRHRAYDDADALLQFVRHAEENFPLESLQSAVKQQLKTPTLPKGLSPELVAELPEEPGVYIFQDEAGSPLYIGKSVNIRKRVLSHFSRDHELSSEFKISQNIAHIEYRQTGGELEALLLESRLIKDLQPLYNRQLRRNRKLTLARLATNPEGYHIIEIEDTEAIDPGRTDDILAVYPTRGRAKQYLELAVREHFLCPKLMNLEKSSGSCFLYQLKKCRGACAGKEDSQTYNARLLDYFEGKRIEDWPYRTPVLIEEKQPTLKAPSKSIVVDQWCILADITQEEECSPVVNAYDRAFDMDAYKILKAYLRDKIHRLNIKPLSYSQLNDLSASEI